MRCPNCGNENPPDYLFCDECGARLIGNDAGAMQVAPDAGMDADAGGGGGAGAPPMPDQGGGDIGSAMANYADYGIEAAPAADQGADAGMPSWDSSMSPMGSADGDTGLSAIPVTEDTMAAEPAPVEAPAMPDVIKPLPLPSLVQSEDNGTDTPDTAMDQGIEAGASAYGDAAESIMGIPDDARMSVEEGMADMTGIAGSAASIGSIADSGPGYTYEPEAVPAPSGDDDADGGLITMSGNDWAANALGLLNNAQSALAGGDWRGFGEAMASLQSALHTAAGEAPTSITPPRRIEPVASLGAGSAMPSLDASASSSAGTDSGAAMSGSSNTSSASPAVSYEAPAAAPVAAEPSVPPVAATTTAEPEASPIEPLPMPSTPSTVTPMATAAPVAAPAPSGARLILISTGAEMAIPDQEEITVGREDPSSGIFPDIDLTPHGGEDGGVSRRHARMMHIGDDYFVEDLQSTNFTKLDGQRLPAHVRERLEDGARLDFGRVAMIFRRS